MNAQVQTIVAVVVAAAMLAGCGPSTQAGSEVLPAGIPLPTATDRPRHEMEVRSMATSSSGDVVVTISGDLVNVRRASDMSPVASGPAFETAEFAKGVAVTPGGHIIAILDLGGELWVWDDDTLKVRPIRTPWGQDPTRLIGFDSKQRLYWISVDKTLVRWDLGQGMVEATQPE